ncbi:UDP-GlcNAc:betaGal beta-1,3-N-acetylglucosaminyltransferase 7-like [Haliotis rufescens]|uniref:UDP-GlcNAc:betaGal beta-1,3-N-acetylglucosaminyltransferase 7-like n=1 Tax=Haliotis rufescens TaxID=6454 RepID=UPI00201F9620|nr:UDP-GlcNAc:betaGal beta-1,3-N-acetylglucosaminyltransferase 7-like [Haliotis rufescens]
MAIENRMYGDVVQGNYLDSYRNLTLKVVSGLCWITQFCFNVRVVAKIDDDTFVDTVKVLKVLIPFLQEHRDVLLCSQSGSALILREGNGVCLNIGFGVFMRGDMIGRLYKAATFSPFLWVDDVYFSGVLPSRLHLKWHRYSSQDFVNVPLCIEVAMDNNERCLLVVTDSAPHHETATSMGMDN